MILLRKLDFFFRAILVRIQDFSAHSRFKCDCAIFVRKRDFLHMRDFSALARFCVIYVFFGGKYFT